MEKLTQKQKKILDFITEFYNTSGIFPTVREIARNFNISIGPVQKYLKILVKKGYLKHKPGLARGFELLTRKPLISVPLLGSIHAGIPSLAYEDILDYIYLDREIVKKGQCFALKVKGDSMSGAGIYPDDIVIVRKQETAENGEIVIALIEDEAVVKKLRKKNNFVILESANPKYPPVTAENIKIIGKVIYLLRNYIKK